jgi:hypothetical protein
MRLKELLVQPFIYIKYKIHLISIYNTLPLLVNQLPGRFGDKDIFFQDARTQIILKSIADVFLWV